jgi:hypothetical protein
VGVVAMGETGGVMGAAAADDAEGLKLKAGNGRALTDFWRGPPADPRRPVGIACSDIGRLGEAVSSGVSMDERCGKTKSGLGTSSMNPEVDWPRRW